MAQPVLLTDADRHRSARGAVFSMFVDSFDVYLPALVLPAAMAYFLPPGLSPEIRATFTTVLFTVGLLGRPLGSFLFGHLSDLLGRRRITLASGWGFTVITLLMGLMPGYASWGYAALGVFAALRLVAGICLAGGYAAPIPLALEQAQPARRGWVGGLIGIGAPGSFLLMNAVLLGVLDSMSRPSFLSWGWRMPFFLGVLLGLVYLWHYRKVVEDESVFATRRRANRPPLVELFTTHRALIGGVFLFTCGYWFATQMSVSFLPTLLVQVLGRSPQLSTTLELIASVITIVVILVLAAVGQRIGRRTLLMRWALLMTVVVAGAFLLLGLTARAGAPDWVVGLLYLIAKVVPSVPLGVILTYLNERFPASVRASGYSIGYMCGLLLPGLYTVWLLALSTIMPYEYGPIVLIVGGGLLMFFAVRHGPETNPPARSTPTAPAATEPAT